MLGKKPDAEVARLVKRSVDCVKARRSKLGIVDRFAKVRPWTRTEERLLGTMPDRELARKLSRGLSGVRLRRQQLGILKVAHWTPVQDRLLGALSDLQIAKRLKKPLQAVRDRRWYLGIRNPAPLVRPWARAEEKLLGTDIDRVIAAKIGRSRDAVLPASLASGYSTRWLEPVIMRDFFSEKYAGRKEHPQAKSVCSE